MAAYFLVGMGGDWGEGALRMLIWGGKSWCGCRGRGEREGGVGV